ncbi:MAG TPA: DUF488 domain-containing protein [Anaerolineales bacterium]
MNTPPATIFTIGHSIRTLEEFIRILRKYGVECLVDVRTVPRSARNPQFNRETLPAALAADGITYVHLPELGGFRHALPDSANTGWRNASFRGFADYMQTDGFRDGVQKLIGLAAGRKTAILCAEAVPWRCHRSLIGDALTARGLPVEDILDADHSQPHRVTPFAHIDGFTVTYPDPGAAGKTDPLGV